MGGYLAYGGKVRPKMLLMPIMIMCQRLSRYWTKITSRLNRMGHHLLILAPCLLDSLLMQSPRSGASRVRSVEVASHKIIRSNRKTLEQELRMKRTNMKEKVRKRVKKKTMNEMYMKRKNRTNLIKMEMVIPSVNPSSMMSSHLRPRNY